MIVTRTYEFDGGRWVPVLEAFVAECGHVHWRSVKPRPFRGLMMTAYDPRRICVCWRGVELPIEALRDGYDVE